MKANPQFKATGDCSSLLDVYDNLSAELHRLSSLTELLRSSGGETSSDPEFLPGVGLLFQDIGDRMEAIQSAFHKLLSAKRKPSKR
jgi:hypothetical protein